MASLLIVDDEVDVREFLRTALTRQGFDVVTVAHLDQGLEEMAKRPFDLVILDAHVRGELGAGMIQRVRAAKNQVPILVYTGGVSAEEEKQFQAAGVSGIILKGSGIFALTDQISKIIHSTAKPNVSTRPNVRTVLVTDDDPAIRRMLRRFLESRHFAVVEADSGRAAIDAVRANTFTAAFLDVNMPGELDGIAALQEIRLLQPELGVIMVSGEQDDRTVGRAVELGAAGYVVKPFDFLYLEMMLISRLEDGSRRA